MTIQIAPIRNEEHYEALGLCSPSLFLFIKRRVVRLALRDKSTPTVTYWFVPEDYSS